MAGDANELGRSHAAQHLQGLLLTSLARRVKQHCCVLGGETRHYRRQQVFCRSSNKLAVGEAAGSGVLPRRLNCQAVQLYPNKGVNQVAELDAEEPNTAINVQEMPGFSLS